MLARAEQIVETLRTKHVADGWTLFEPAAEEMLGFFRRRLEGKPELDHEFKMDVVEFFKAHGGKLEAMRVRPGDVELGIRAFIGRLGDERNSFNIDVLRNAMWPQPDSAVELVNSGVVAERLFEPSSEARERADEIIAAHEPDGYTAPATTGAVHARLKPRRQLPRRWRGLRWRRSMKKRNRQRLESYVRRLRR